MQFMEAKEAKYLLREVPYEKWLPVGRMMVPKGVHTSRVGSLEELEWTMKPTAKTLVALRFENLERWLRESIEDRQLADEVKAYAAQGLSYVETSKLIYEALHKRVESLKKIASQEEVSDA